MRKRQIVGNRGDAIGRLRAQLVAALDSHLATGRPARPPLAGVILWQTFGALSQGRSYGDAGPGAISAAEIEAYGRLMQIELPPHHVAILRAMDAAWLKWARTPEKDRPAGELTGAAFDAVFG